jgi:DNA-binding winged helix-turn-helix (wHTH) protein
MLMALIEASGVVSKDELSSRAWRGRIVDQNRQPGSRLPDCAKALAPTASSVVHFTILS